MSSLKKIRLDKLLFDRGLAESRERAKALILGGNVRVNGIAVDKAGSLVSTDDAVVVTNKMPFVSRGGLKLEHAIKEFSVGLKDKTAMDVGASTGGFTDCLLQYGARKIYAIDVGYGQFSYTLRKDDRIELFERTNIRHFDRSLIPEEIDVATVDVSFISLLKVLPKVLEFLSPQGEVIALIKPQFEVGLKDVGKGVVKDEKKRLEVVERLTAGSEKMGFEVKGVVQSPIKGPKGNVEYLMYLKKKKFPPFDRLNRLNHSSGWNGLF